MKSLLTSLLLLISLCSFAKTTYIPTYFSMIGISTNGKNIVDSTSVRLLELQSDDGLFNVNVLHDEVSQERIKQIKMSKMAGGWAAASAVVSGLAACLTPLNNTKDVARYMRYRNQLVSSTMQSIARYEEANELQRVPITIIIENTSDEEICINDMNRGLIWFIPPHDYISLTSGNPEFNSFRISTVNYSKSKVSYVDIQAGNVLTKHEIAYEDEDCWIVPISSDNRKYVEMYYEDDSDDEDKYERIDKILMTRRVYTKKELKDFLTKKKR